MPIKRVSLIGAGGHAKVVLEALRAANPKVTVQVLDESGAAKKLLGIAVGRFPEDARFERSHLHDPDEAVLLDGDVPQVG